MIFTIYQIINHPHKKQKGNFMNEQTNPKKVDVYFIRRGDTKSDDLGLTSAVNKNLPLTESAKEKTTETNKIYKALLNEGKITETTPIYINNSQSVRKTAINFSGREHGDKSIKHDSRLNKRLKHTTTDEHRNFDGVMTKQLEKEFGNEKDTPQSIEAHRKMVTSALGLTEDIRDSDDKITGFKVAENSPKEPIIVVAHASSINRLMEHFERNERNDKKIESAAVHHASSLDGGKTWKVTKLSVDEKGKTVESSIESRKPDNKITLEEILTKKLDKLKNEQGNIPTVTNINLDKNGDGESKLIVQTNGILTSREQVIQLRDALGELLIGNNHQELGKTKIDKKTITVELDKTQTQILEKFVQAKNMNPLQSTQHSISY